MKGTRTHQQLQGIYFGMNKLVPLALSTGGNDSVDMHMTLKDVAKHRAQMYCIAFSAAEDNDLIRRETSILRPELSITLQDTSPHWSRVYLQGRLLHAGADLIRRHHLQGRGTSIRGHGDNCNGERGG